jgi:hypothetical protein
MTEDQLEQEALGASPELKNPAMDTEDIREVFA